MSTEKLVAFGDSWSFGAELLDNEKNYIQLIAEERGITFQNYSEPAAANEHLVFQLQSMIGQADFETHKYTAIFSVTDLARFTYFNDRIAHTGPSDKFHSNTGYRMYYGTDDDVSENFFKYIHSPRYENFKFYLTILTLQNLCRQYNIDDYYALSFSRVDWKIQDYVGLDRSKFYNLGNTNFIDLFGARWPADKENKYFAGKQGHPNQLGHELIAKTLTEWIK